MDTLTDILGVDIACLRCWMRTTDLIARTERPSRAGEGQCPNCLWLPGERHLLGLVARPVVQGKLKLSQRIQKFGVPITDHFEHLAAMIVEATPLYELCA